MLEARSLTKYYNHTLAVRNVSFTVQPGEILGYLGARYISAIFFEEPSTIASDGRKAPPEIAHIRQTRSGALF